MKRNLVGKILGKIKIFVQDFVPIRTALLRALNSTPLYSSIIKLYAQKPVFEIVHDEHVKVYLHMYNGNIQQNPLCVESCVTKEFSISPRFSPTIFYRYANNSVTNTSTPLYSSINRLYAQKPVFEIVREVSVKVYLHINIGNVQQNPLCVESCVTKEFSISPRLSPTMFDADANSVLVRAHHCAAVDSMRRKPCVRNCS